MSEYDEQATTKILNVSQYDASYFRLSWVVAHCRHNKKDLWPLKVFLKYRLQAVEICRLQYTYTNPKKIAISFCVDSIPSDDKQFCLTYKSKEYSVDMNR